MKIKLVQKLLTQLAKEGNPKLANKLWKSLTGGKPVSLTLDEQQAYKTIAKGMKGREAEIQTSLGHGFGIRRGSYYHNPTSENPLLRKGDFSRSVFSEHKKMPIVDVDLNDPLSHLPAQVTHQTLKDFQPALMDFMKMSGGKNAALKISRTPAGLRIMDVGKAHRGVKPSVYEGGMQDLGADGFFMNMAKISETYNARLMPKPGRNHNIWGLPGNATTRLPDWHLKNPGDFVAKQVHKNRVIMGQNAEIDPRSWNESLFHDRAIKQIIDRQKVKEIIQIDNLLDLVTF